MFQHVAPNGVKIARNGQIHDGIGSGGNGHVKLGAFTFRLVLEGRSTDIGIYLHAGRLPHNDGADILMRGIAEQHHGSRVQGMFDRLGDQLLFLGNMGDMFIKNLFQSGIGGKEIHIPSGS